MRKPELLYDTTALRRRLKTHAGFTLIELVVAIAISAIILVCFASVFILTYKSFNGNTSAADAQNLAMLTVQKIQSETRNCQTLTINTSQTSNASGTKQLYFDTKNNGISVGGNTYLAETFKNYVCTLTFSGTGTDLLGLAIKISDNYGHQLYQTSTSVYLNDKEAISGAVSGGYIVYTPPS